VPEDVPILTILNDAVGRAIEGGPEPLREALRQLSNDELNTFYYQLAEIRGEVTTVLMERNEPLPAFG
jgi:hypothetical protein